MSRDHMTIGDAK